MMGWSSSGADHELGKLWSSLEELSADRPQRTIELSSPNDYYGHAATLKRYSGLPAGSQLPASVVHGLRFDGGFWEYDFAPFHCMGFVASPWHVQGLRGKVEHDLRAVGPLIHYAEGLWTEEQLSAVRAALGRILLVYPVHSTHWVDTDYDVEAFCSEVDAAATGFDSVVVCMYWKDVLRGVHRRYEARGYRCVTNGHIYDLQFLQRQRSLLEACAGVLTNGIGTHVGYAVHLGKPVQVLPSQVTRSARGPGRVTRSTFADAIRREIAQGFSASPVCVTEQQRALADQYWGFCSALSRAEMRHLLEEAQSQRREKFFCLDLREEVAACVRIARKRLQELKTHVTGRP